MATARSTPPMKVVYPTSDGRPMAETDYHRQDMTDLIETLQDYYRNDPQVYVSGNLLLFYVPGNKRKHISPDVFVVRGVPKQPRLYHLLWEEKKGPDLVIEITSSSTRAEDTRKKFELYQKVLKVNEYFLFDPFEDYLHPSMQGYRLSRGRYLPIRPILGRLPSQTLGLHLDRSSWHLRLYDPQTQQWVPTLSEKAAQAETKLAQAETKLAQAEAAALRELLARQQAETEIARLRLELLQRGS